jgi:hypothetical protein
VLVGSFIYLGDQVPECSSLHVSMTDLTQSLLLSSALGVYLLLSDRRKVG